MDPTLLELAVCWGYNGKFTTPWDSYLEWGIMGLREVPSCHSDRMDREGFPRLRPGGGIGVGSWLLVGLALRVANVPGGGTNCLMVKRREGT